MNYYVYIKVKSRSRKVEVIKNLKRWKITSGTRGSPVDDAFCIFLWNSSIKELCCVVRRSRCCVISCVALPDVPAVQGVVCKVRRVRCCAISCAVLPVARRCVLSCAVRRARCCVLSYVVTLFEVTRVRCKTLEGVRAKRKRPKPPRASRGLSLCACRGLSPCAQRDVCRSMRRVL